MSAADTAALQRALQLHTLGRLDEAIGMYRDILDREPAQPDALHLLGTALTQSGAAHSGAAAIRESLELNARQPAAWVNLGNAELALAHAGEALRCHEQALALAPTFALAHNGRGRALLALERFAEALQAFERALELAPALSPAVGGRGEALLKLNRPEEAVAALDAALRVHPDRVDLHINRGIANCALGRFTEAQGDAERASRTGPDSPEVLYLRCAALIGLDSFEQLLQEVRRGGGYGNDDAQLEYYTGAALVGLGREAEAVAAYERAVRLRGHFPDALFELGTLCLRLRRFERAAWAFDRLLELAPERDFVRGTRLHARLQVCDWRDYETEVQAIVAAVDAGMRADLPLSFMAICDDPARQLACTRAFAAGRPRPAVRFGARSRPGHGRIRIAYVSADFLEHPVAHLLAGVIEAHDRDQFEVIGISLRADPRSPTQRRLQSAFDRFIDVTVQSNAAIAQLIHDLEADIAVDLMGYTAAARPDVFARCPAPVQVCYLGYPGTLCAPYIGHLLADGVVIPVGEERHYTEQVWRLPGCYLPNDRRRRIGPPPTRTQAGLPERGLVWSAATLAYKINPPLFDVWARLLREVPDSVLWLRSMGTEGQGNLRRELERRGVAPGRVLFAAHVPGIADHLARLGLADLCLDTFPYNSHSTACDALWAGVPVLTCAGRGMASRVAASALGALGLDDLVTRDLREYAARALELAAVPGRLPEVRARLQRARESAPLFDTVAYARALEQAFVAMLKP